MAQVKTELERLEEVYIIKDGEEIQDLLTPQMVETLLDGAVEIPKYFPNEGLALGVVTYPDEPGYKRLFIYIIVDDPEDVDYNIDRLHLVDDNWLLKLPLEKRRNLNTFIGYKDEF
jgi:hypothetical protein